MQHGTVDTDKHALTQPVSLPFSTEGVLTEQKAKFQKKEYDQQVKLGTQRTHITVCVAAEWGALIEQPGTRLPHESRGK